MSDILWPSIPSQLVAADARVLGKSICRIGNVYWAGGDMSLGPMDATAFPILLNRLVEADIPFRISFLIEGGGVYATQLRTFMATIMGPTNASNKQIKYSLEGLQALARNEPVVRLRVSFATWCMTEEKMRFKTGFRCSCRPLRVGVMRKLPNFQATLSIALCLRRWAFTAAVRHQPELRRCEKL